MTSPRVKIGGLPLPPSDYSQSYLNALLRQIETTFKGVTTPAPLTGVPDPGTNSKYKSGLRLTNTPLSPNNLSSGDVWGDISGTPTVFVGTGSVSGTTLTITAVTSGTLAVGNGVTGTNIPDGSRVLTVLTGSGGIGTYELSQSFTAASTTVTGFTSPVLRYVP